MKHTITKSELSGFVTKSLVAACNTKRLYFLYDHVREHAMYRVEVFDLGAMVEVFEHSYTLDEAIEIYNKT